MPGGMSKPSTIEMNRSSEITVLSCWEKLHLQEVLEKGRSYSGHIGALPCDTTCSVVVVK